MAVKIAISNAKGGVGKTTTAITLAQNLKRRKKKVLIIDADPQCNTTRFYSAATEDTATMEDILCSNDTLAEECIQHLEYGDIIPCENELHDAENMIHADDYRSLHLKRAGKNLDSMYDYIIIDTPPAAGVIVRNVLAFTDYVIIPVQESGWSLDGLMTYYESTIQQSLDVTNPNLKIAGILIVMSKPRTNESKRIRGMAESLAEKIGTKVFDTSIRTSVKVTESLTDFCVPLHDFAPGCTADEDYEAFTIEVLKLTSKNK